MQDKRYKQYEYIIREVGYMNDKTQFTIKHAQAIYQTIADILSEKYNVTIIAKVTEKANDKDKKAVNS